MKVKNGGVSVIYIDILTLASLWEGCILDITNQIYENMIIESGSVYFRKDNFRKFRIIITF